MLWTCFIWFVSSQRDGTNEDNLKGANVVWRVHGSTHRSLSLFLTYIGFWKNTQPERFLHFFCVCSIQVVENLMNPYGKQVAAKEAAIHAWACIPILPVLYATDFPPLLVGFSKSPIIQQGNACCITLASLLQSCRCPRGVIMMISSLCQRSKSACLANCVWC